MKFLGKRFYLIFLAGISFCFLIASIDALPIYLSDEIGYLLKAAHLGGHSSYFSTSWSAGYSIFTAPLFFVFGITKIAFHAVYFLNAVCVVLSLAIYNKLLQRLGIQKVRSLSLVFSTLLCFGSWAYAFWMFPNALLGLIISLNAYLLVDGEIRNRWLCLAALAGFAYLVHPSGLLVGLADISVILFSKWQSTRRRLGRVDLSKMNESWFPESLFLFFSKNWRICSSVSVFLVIIAATSSINRMINLSMSGVDKGHYSSMISLVISKLYSSPLQSLPIYLVSLLNGISSLSLATFGFGIVALLAFFYQLNLSLRGEPRICNSIDASRQMFLGFSSILCLLMILFSASLSLEDSDKYQYMFHQRYTAVSLQALWIAGIAFYGETRSRLTKFSLIISSTLPVVFSCLVAIFAYRYTTYFSVVDLMPSMSSVLSNWMALDSPIVFSSLIGLPLVALGQVLGASPWLLAFVPYVFATFWGVLDNRRISINGYSAIPVLKEFLSKESSGRICLASFGTQATVWETENKHEFYFPSSRIPRVYNRLTGKAELSEAGDCDYLMAPVDLRYFSKTDQERSLVASEFSEFRLKAIDLDQGWQLLAKPALAAGSISLLSARFEGGVKHASWPRWLDEIVFASPMVNGAFENLQKQAVGELFSVETSADSSPELAGTVFLAEVNPWRVELQPGKYLIALDPVTQCSDLIQVWSVDKAGIRRLLPGGLVGDRASASLTVLEPSTYRFELRAMPGACISIPNLFLIARSQGPRS